MIPTFSNEQIKTTLEVTKTQMYFTGVRNSALITLLYDIGCRISELLNLKISDVQMDEKVLVVKGKGAKGRVV